VRLEELPPNLSTLLTLTTNRKLVSKCRALRGVSNACLVSIMAALEGRIIVPGEQINFEGGPLSAVHFVLKGKVQLLERGVPRQVVREHDSFGVDDFMRALITGTRAVCRHSVMAITYCDLSRLTIERLADLVGDDADFCKMYPSISIFRTMYPYISIASSSSKTGRQSHRPPAIPSTSSSATASCAAAPATSATTSADAPSTRSPSPLLATPGTPKPLPPPAMPLAALVPACASFVKWVGELGSGERGSSDAPGAAANPAAASPAAPPPSPAVTSQRRSPSFLRRASKSIHAVATGESSHSDGCMSEGKQPPLARANGQTKHSTSEGKRFEC